MTKRISLIFGGEPPPDAPQVMWVGDQTTADDVAERVPGAVGFVDLDSADAEVQGGALTDDEVAAQVESILGRSRASRT